MWMTYSISHLHRQCTEKAKRVASEWITGRLANHHLYRPRKSWVFRPALKPPWDEKNGCGPVSKSAVSAFFQMACGHGLNGAYLKRFKIKDHEGCGWCDGRSKQTRSHLFGQCRGLRREYNRLCVEANKIRAKSQKNRRYHWRPWMFFQEEGLERCVMDYMRRTGVGFKVCLGGDLRNLSPNKLPDGIMNSEC